MEICCLLQIFVGFIGGNVGLADIIFNFIEIFSLLDNHLIDLLHDLKIADHPFLKILHLRIRNSLILFGLQLLKNNGSNNPPRHFLSVQFYRIFVLLHKNHLAFLRNSIPNNFLLNFHRFFLYIVELPTPPKIFMRLRLLFQHVLHTNT